MKRVIITVKFEAAVDDKADASEAVGYVLDSGSMQDAITEYAADHGCAIDITRSTHDVEADLRSSDERDDPPDAVLRQDARDARGRS